MISVLFRSVSHGLTGLEPQKKQQIQVDHNFNLDEGVIDLADEIWGEIG